MAEEWTVDPAPDAAPPDAAPEASGGSWLPTMGEIGGNMMGAAKGALMAEARMPIGSGPGRRILGGMAGAAAGAMAGRTVGSVVAGEGVPSAGSLAVTGAVNAGGEGLFGLGSATFQGRKAFQKGAQELLTRLRTQVGTTAVETGQALKSAIMGGINRRVKAETAKHYATFLADAKNMNVNGITHVVDAAKQMLTRLGDPKKHADPDAAQEAVKVLTRVAKWTNGKVSVEEIHNGYRELQDMFGSYQERTLKPILDNRVETALLTALDGTIEQAVKGTPAEASRNLANRWFATEAAPFRKNVLKETFGVSETPSELINGLTTGPPEKFLSYWKHADASEKETLRGGWWRQTFETIKDDATGEIDPTKLQNAWHQMHWESRAKFVDGQEAAYETVINAMPDAAYASRMKASVYVGPASLALHGAYAFYTGNYKMAITSLVASGGVAKVMANPHLMKYLAGVTRTPEGTKAAIHAGARFMTSAIQAGIFDEQVAQPMAGYGDTSAAQGPQGSLAGQ